MDTEHQRRVIFMNISLFFYQLTLFFVFIASVFVNLVLKVTMGFCLIVRGMLP